MIKEINDGLAGGESGGHNWRQFRYWGSNGKTLCAGIPFRHFGHGGDRSFCPFTYLRKLIRVAKSFPLPFFSAARS